LQEAAEEAENAGTWPTESMFEDVYAEPWWNLAEQQRELKGD
jgi:TPP-dependent pyruvate/acetoin dehydrogenase alpha subunit